MAKATKRDDEMMRTLAKALDDVLNGKDCPFLERKVGFALLVFNFGDNPDRERVNWVSNANRDDMVVALKEIVARFEGRFVDAKKV